MNKQIFIAILLALQTLLLAAQEQQRPSLSELIALIKQSKADTNRIRLLLDASLKYILLPGNRKNDMDSALYFTDKAMRISDSLNETFWKGKCNYVYSQLHREKGESSKGKEYIEKAIGQMLKSGHKNDLGDAYFERAMYYDPYSEKEWLLRVKNYEEAEKLYSQTGNKLKQANTLKDLGDCYQLWNKDSISLVLLERSLAIYQSLNYPNVQGVYDLMGYVFYSMGNLKQALKYALLAVQTAEKAEMTNPELTTIYNRTGLIYYKLSQYDNAVQYFKKAVSIAIASHDSVAILIVAPNVINSYLRLKRQADLISFLKEVKGLYGPEHSEQRIAYLSAYVLAWLLSNEYKKAEPYTTELIRLVGNAKDITHTRPLHRAILPYYLASGQYKEMYKYLPANEHICKQYGITSGLADNYLWWYTADSALGKHNDAIAHYKLYKEANDSVMRLATNNQIAQLHVEYETSKKDRAIAMNEKNIQLLTNQGQLQKTQLNQTRLLKNLVLGVMGLMIVTIVLLFSRYRLKQRNTKILEQQQKEINQKNMSLQKLINQKEKLLEEKEWLVKEIHHRVKNNMQIVMSLLNTQSAYLENDALAAIRDSQHRMQAMSLIHQKLYQSENTTSINMPAYIMDLINYLEESYNVNNQIRIYSDVENIDLDVAQAVPVGLILNESITNSIKYGFPDKNQGTIQIVMKHLENGHLLLSVSDNGIGLKDDFSANSNKSFGMNLIHGLTKQLSGSITVTSLPGLKIEITFPYEVSGTAKNEEVGQHLIVTAL
jgi:two-component system, sensor histidine kinase PdtaS